MNRQRFLAYIVALFILPHPFDVGSECKRPVIENGAVIFSNGVTVQFAADESGSESKSEKVGGEAQHANWNATVIDHWRRVVLVRQERDLEWQGGALRILDWEGGDLCENASLRFMGQAIVLVTAQRILLPQQSAQYHNGDVVLVDPQCKIVARVPQSDNAEGVGVTEDEQLWWITTFEIVRGRARTRVQVYDGSGSEVASAVARVAGALLVYMDGREYRIPIAAPKWPG